MPEETKQRALKFKAKVKEEEVIVVVDTGATHNFVSQQLINRMGLIIQPMTRYIVTTNTSEKVMRTSCCNELLVEFPMTIVKDNFLILPLVNIDIILGLK